MSDQAAEGGLTYTDMLRERIEAPAAKVWPILSDFGAIGRYVPHAQVERVEGEGVGCVRIIPNPRGVVREQLTALDEAARTFSYRVLPGSPVGMEDYSSDVRLVEQGPDACRVEWGGRFATASVRDAAAHKKGLEQFYRNAIEGIRGLV